MEPISTLNELKTAIQILEFDHAIKEQQLKEQIYLIHESLKPVNLIKSALQEVVSSPYLIDNILGATMGLASGYISRKLIVGGSHNIIRKLFGTIFQFGITNVVSQHTDPIKAVGQYIYQHFLHKNEANSDKL
jgi:hypothetical protein